MRPIEEHMKVTDNNELVAKYLEGYTQFAAYNAGLNSMPVQMLAKYITQEFYYLKRYLQHYQEWFILNIDVHRCTRETRFEHIYALQDIIEHYPTTVPSSYHLMQESMYPQCCNTINFLQNTAAFIRDEYQNKKSSGVRIPLRMPL